ncbi:transcription elongation factor spt5 [Coemansia sp. RSA 988]|nr:transcription elongation factor spt5 [Coemansia sp. RSA 988]
MAEVEDMFDDNSEVERYSEEDEDEEEEDDERYQKRGREDAKKSSRRKRTKTTSNFLDIEASVETDDEDYDDEDDEALGDFIVENERELATAEQDALRHRSAARPPVFQDDDTLDADAIEAQLRERYSGYATAGSRGAPPPIDADWVPQRLIIPGINDPHLWMSRCSPGKERDVVLAAARRVLQWSGSAKYKGVYSVYCRDGLSGYIYVEARTLADAQAALEGIPGVFSSKMTLVPIDDMIDVVKVKSHMPKLNPGSWVRVRRGNYAGDLAQVVSILESSDSVEVRLLPRLDYSTQGSGRASKRGTRPAQRLFSIEDAQRADPRTLTSRQNEILWKSDRFINGYLHKDMRIVSLQLDNVNPTLEEIAKFAAGEAGEDGDEQAAIAALANQAAAATMGGVEEANGLGARDLQQGEQVEVIEGDLAGVVGVVRSVEGNNVVRIEPELGALARSKRGGTMSFPASQLRKRFRTGDHVKVLNGRHANETGMVLDVADAVATVYTDVSKSEIRVLTKDLRVSSDIGTSTKGGESVIVGLDVHDLVHLDGNQMGIVLKAGKDMLTVLDDRNETRVVPPRAVRPARGNFERTGVDFNGNALRRGDAVREAGGARRQGTVLQVTRFSTFIKARDHDGAFAVRTRQVESMSARQNSLDPYATRNVRGGGGGGDRGRGRGRGGRVGSLRGGRDPLIGKTVIANRGPYKGYVGIVKDVMGNSVRVELHTNARVVNVEKDKLMVRLPSGETIPVVDYTSMPGPGAAQSTAPSRGASNDAGSGGWGGNGGAADGGWAAPSPAPSSGGGWAGASGGGSDNGGWGASSSSSRGFGDARSPPTAAAASPGGFGGWDAGGEAYSGGGGGGGWDAPTPSSTGAAAPGWGNTGSVTGGNWGTPAPITPGALPQTPGGPYPQTPGNTGGYYDAPTPGAKPTDADNGSNSFFSWAVPRAMVVLGSSSQRGTIREIAAERQQAIIQLESGGSQVVDRNSVARLDPRPVRAEKRDRVVVIRGTRKGALGTMVGKDGTEALFQADGDSTWHPEALRNLAIYNDNI